MFDVGGAGFGDDLIVIRDDDGVAYAVPRIEMERFRMTPQRQSLIAAQLLTQAATSGGVQLPIDEPPVYEVDLSELAPFRLSRAAWTRLESALYGGTSDVQGFESGQLRPSWVALAPARHAPPPA